MYRENNLKSSIFGVIIPVFLDLIIILVLSSTLMSRKWSL